MFDLFMYRFQPGPNDVVLDAGVTSDRDYGHSNYFESWYPHKSAVTAVGVEDASFLEETYPGMKFVCADACDLPFEDATFDYVHSGAVLEHVGSRQRQADFISELWRVARKGIFITTPNRWFPVEVHTVLPLLHYLPAPQFRRSLRALGGEYAFFADEENLNLVGAGDLLGLAKHAGLAQAKVARVRLFGLASNLVLLAAR